MKRYRFADLVARVLARAYPQRHVAAQGATLEAAGIASVRELTRFPRARWNDAELMSLVAWLLARWPRRRRDATFFAAAQKLLGHPHPSVRAEAARSLGMFATGRELGVLRRFLRRERDEAARTMAVSGLGLVADATPLLLRVASDDAEAASVRDVAIDELATRPLEDTEAVLRACLASKNAVVRAAAAEAFTRARPRTATAASPPSAAAGTLAPRTSRGPSRSSRGARPSSRTSA